MCAELREQGLLLLSTLRLAIRRPLLLLSGSHPSLWGHRQRPRRGHAIRSLSRAEELLQQCSPCERRRRRHEIIRGGQTGKIRLEMVGNYLNIHVKSCFGVLAK